MPFDDEKKIKRLKEKKENIINNATKAMNEGRDKRVDRLVPRAVRVQNRIITLEEKGKMAMRNDAIDKLSNLDTKDEAAKYLQRGPSKNTTIEELAAATEAAKKARNEEAAKKAFPGYKAQSKSTGYWQMPK